MSLKKIILFLLLLCAASQSTYAMPLFSDRGNVTVITYHRLSPNPAHWNDYCISPQQFEQDIVSLKEAGYTFLKASQLSTAATVGKQIAVLTFDDGYDSDYRYALPILRKHGVCATFFVIGSMLGQTEYMSVKQLKSLSESPYAEIGNHSYSLHSYQKTTLEILYKGKKSDDTILADFKKNGAVLSKITGKHITALSYPNGVYSDSMDEKLKQQGYLITFSTKEIPFRQPSEKKPVGRKNRSFSRPFWQLTKA